MDILCKLSYNVDVGSNSKYGEKLTLVLWFVYLNMHIQGKIEGGTEL